MKNILKIVALSSFAALFVACEKNSGTVYSGDNYINFVKDFVSDSTLYSFAYEVGVESATVPLGIEIASTIEAVDRAYSVRFLASESTAKEGVHFDKIGDNTLFRANHSVDSLYITVKKTADLSEKQVYAVFELVANENFSPGIIKNRKAKLYITNQLSKPLWWDQWHDTSGLGIYSEKKYRLFIEHSGEYDLDYEKRDDLDYSQMRAYILKFKYYVLENNITEEDGNPMVIAIRG